jgi:hypothetical protein
MGALIGIGSSSVKAAASSAAMGADEVEPRLQAARSDQPRPAHQRQLADQILPRTYRAEVHYLQGTDSATYMKRGSQAGSCRGFWDLSASVVDRTAARCASRPV